VRTGIVIVITAVAAVSACSADAPAAAPKVPSFNSSSASSPSSGNRAFPKICSDVVTQDEVSDLLQAAITGQIDRVQGIPEPKINRTARLDCYYGIPAGADRSVAVVSISLASYSDEAAARKRMNSTVSDEKAAGAKPSEIPIGPDRGVLLTGKRRTLVAVRGNTTIVVSVAPDLVPDDQAPSLIGKLADRALSGH
jgi:hypothetical protein